MAGGLDLEVGIVTASHAARLRRAIDERTGWLIYVRLDDELAPLRADPRYAALDRQLRY